MYSKEDLRVATPIPKDVRMEQSKIQHNFKIISGTDVKLRQETSEAQIPWGEFNFLLIDHSFGNPAMRNADGDEPIWKNQICEELCKWLERSLSKARRCECCEIVNQQERCSENASILFSIP